jgi:hypothetical protein
MIGIFHSNHTLLLVGPRVAITHQVLIIKSTTTTICIDEPKAQFLQQLVDKEGENLNLELTSTDGTASSTSRTQRQFLAETGSNGTP